MEKNAEAIEEAYREGFYDGADQMSAYEWWSHKDGGPPLGGVRD